MCNCGLLVSCKECERMLIRVFVYGMFAPWGRAFGAISHHINSMEPDEVYGDLYYAIRHGRNGFPIMTYGTFPIKGATVEIPKAYARILDKSFFEPEGLSQRTIRSTLNGHHCMTHINRKFELGAEVVDPHMVVR